jgi:hypothetical protein
MRVLRALLRACACVRGAVRCPQPRACVHVLAARHNASFCALLRTQLKETAPVEEPDLEALINPKKKAKADAAKARTAFLSHCARACLLSSPLRLHARTHTQQAAKAQAKEAELASLPNLHPELCAAFEELADFEFRKKDIMRALAYRKVAKALRETGECVASGKQAMKLPGIGKSSAEKARSA